VCGLYGGLLLLLRDLDDSPSCDDQQNPKTNSEKTLQIDINAELARGILDEWKGSYF
jgi:hypothetical protein